MMVSRAFLERDILEIVPSSEDSKEGPHAVADEEPPLS